MLVYLILIWRYDRYDREPFWLVLQNYLWGGLGAIFFAIIGSSLVYYILSFFIPNQVQLERTEVILVAPFVEEITKGLFLLIVFRNKKFDNATDGIVYGGAIGLGFGMTENFLYFIAYGGASFPAWITIVTVRTLFSGIMHCAATAIFGAFLGYSKFKNIFYKIIFPPIGIFIAMFIHFAWNYSVSFESTTLIGFIFVFFTVIIFVIVFSVAIFSEKRIIYQELLEEAMNGLIPAVHLDILNSSKRNKSGWVDESVRKLYIRAATTLAFRKMELKSSTGSSRRFYEKDVEYYRSFIQNLLAQSQMK
ncbi:MAG: PrsW family intramembrane metalloprotease [Ignavibacteriaceae bacterium]|nr:PrsW family intramembrane metalloprotease [Ignavibacteriaceae bacterium]